MSNRVYTKSWSIVLLTVVAALVTALVYVQLTPLYVSTTRLYTDFIGGHDPYRRIRRRTWLHRCLPSVARLTPDWWWTASVGPPELSAWLRMQARRVTSRPIITATLDDPNIRTLRSLANADDPVTCIGRMLSAVVAKKDDIIAVSVCSPYPEDSASIANAVVGAYIREDRIKADSYDDFVRLRIDAYQELSLKRTEKQRYEAERQDVVENQETSEYTLLLAEIEALRKLYEKHTRALNESGEPPPGIWPFWSLHSQRPSHLIQTGTRLWELPCWGD